MWRVTASTWFVLAAAAGCGDNIAPHAIADAPPPVPCTARLTGNVTATWTGPTCASLAGAQLTFAIPAAPFDAPMTVTLELAPTAAAGTYSSDTVSTWSALASRTLDFVTCHFRAGGDVVPHGDFELTLDDASPGAPHGALTVTLYVLDPPLTDCGAGPLEHAAIRF